MQSQILPVHWQNMLIQLEKEGNFFKKQKNSKNVIKMLLKNLCEIQATVDLV
jgi:hypothetical protein